MDFWKKKVPMMQLHNKANSSTTIQNAVSQVLLQYLDYSKAFDTTEHEILLDKLYNIVIRGICLSLIKSYTCRIEHRW